MFLLAWVYMEAHCISDPHFHINNTFLPLASFKIFYFDLIFSNLFDIIRYVHVYVLISSTRSSLRFWVYSSVSIANFEKFLGIIS